MLLDYSITNFFRLVFDDITLIKDVYYFYYYSSNPYLNEIKKKSLKQFSEVNVTRLQVNLFLTVNERTVLSSCISKRDIEWTYK